MAGIVERIRAARETPPASDISERIRAARGDAPPIPDVVTGPDARDFERDSERGGGEARRLFMQGATFGFADEAEAAMRAIWDRAPGEDFGDAYLRNRTQVRKQIEEFRAEHPGVAIGAEVSGAIAVFGAPSGRLVAQGATLTTKTGRAAAVGGGLGAVQGAGIAENLEDVPMGMATGGAIGAVAGGVVPAVATGAGNVWSGVRGAMVAESGAAHRVGQAMGRDEVSTSEIIGALDEARALGRPATAADVGGASVRRELEVAVQSPGPAGQAAERILSERNAGQLQRLSSDLVRGTGIAAESVEDVIEKTMTVRAKAAAPVYKRAMEFSAELNDEIVAAWQSAIKTPLGKLAMTKARKILNVEEFETAPLMERINAFKRGLDDIIGNSKRSGENAIAGKALEVKREIVGLVDRVNPDYKKARAIWENDSNYLDAIDRGREVLKPGFTAAKLKREFGGLGDSEQEAFRIGVVDAVITRMRQQAAKEPNLIKLMRSPEIRDKLKSVMTPDKAKEFDRIIDLEDAMFSTSSQVRHGSQTAQRTAAMEEQAKQLGMLRGLDFVLELLITPMRWIAIKAIPALPRAARDRLLARQNAVIAKRLLSSDPDEVFSIAEVAPTPPMGSLVPGATVGTNQ